MSVTSQTTTNTTTTAAAASQMREHDFVTIFAVLAQPVSKVLKALDDREYSPDPIVRTILEGADGKPLGWAYLAFDAPPTDWEEKVLKLETKNPKAGEILGLADGDLAVSRPNARRSELNEFLAINY